jgi:hypothetical protein
MHQLNPEEALAADLEALCEKHGLDTGLVAVTHSDHFLIVTCNMTAENMRSLGVTLFQCAPPADAVLN